MNDEEYQQFLKFQEWQKSQPHYRHNTINEMGVVEEIPEPPPTTNNVLVPKHYIWAAGAGAIVLLILAFPFTIFGFVLGLFTKWNFWRDRR